MTVIQMAIFNPQIQLLAYIISEELSLCLRVLGLTFDVLRVALSLVEKREKNKNEWLQ